MKISTRLNTELRWETLGTEVVALDSEAAEVYRLSGPSAAVARHLLTGVDHGLSAEDYTTAVEALVAKGLVKTTDEVLTRRALVKFATVAAVGVTVIALPTAAAAASGGVQNQSSPPVGGGTTTSSSSTSSTTTTTIDNLPDPNVTLLSNGSIEWTQPNQ